DDLLDIARITSGKIVLHRQRIPLADTIETAVEMARPLIRERNHSLKVHLPEQPVWINGDATRLSQLFGNLLSNAAKYTDPGGRIEINAHAKEDEAVIRVHDNGIGIPPDKLDYIFDMFAQVDNSIERAQGGLGIGLTLVRNIAELHGGRIEAHSAGCNKGSEFIVRLPVLKPSQKEMEENVPNPITPSSNRYRVLVVDDNEASAKTLGWMLEMLGHEVKLALDGPSAIETAHVYRPDIVLLDIGLPDMNGYEVCAAMRSDPALEHTAFIAQTGWGQEQHLQRSKEAGFDYHLIKPISIKALQEQIEKIAGS
ncbi:MAG: response regulator, partial [Pseudomonadota bacterium]|nr:response regulator [Pseudomonadota bacterium]